MSSLQTEDDLRGTILLPLLTELGIAKNCIHLEKNFTIRLGKSMHEIGSRDAQGYSDILVKSDDGANLFLVELKRSDKELTDADRDQAISYARLLDQMAPFVVLTNGRETQLFDTITKNPINAPELGLRWKKWSSSPSVAIGDDIELRWEALQNFVGMSTENVTAFSQAHLARSLEPLKVGLNGPIGRFVPQLYVPRSYVRAEFDAFLSEDRPVFVLSGESGSGKTNEMCALAEEYASTHVVLFFAAGELHCELSKTIELEFNWNFSTTQMAPQLFRRLARIGQKVGKPILIFVDALDEARVPAFESSVNELIRYIVDSTKGEIRLVLSVLQSEWKRFAKVGPNPSRLALALPVETRPDGGSTSGTGRPVFLREFSARERDSALAAYATAFRLRGEPRSKLRERCSSPLFLRVLAEVYEGGARALPDDVRDSDLARAWLKRSLQSARDEDATERNLVRFAKHIRDRPAKDKTTVAPQGVRDLEMEEAGLELDPELLRRGFILESKDQDGRVWYRFGQSFVRDYLLARRVLELDRLSDVRFKELLPSLLESDTLSRALTWHLREAAYSQQHVLHEFVRGRALAFTIEYNQLRQELSPEVAAAVDPMTGGDVGIAYSMYGANLDSAALFPVNISRKEFVVEFEQSLFARRDGRESAWELGARSVWQRTSSFVDSSPELAAQEYLLGELRGKRVAEALSNFGSRTLLVETANAICRSNAALLGLELPPFDSHLSRWESTANLNDIEEALQEMFALEYFRDEWVAEQARMNSEYVTFEASLKLVEIPRSVHRGLTAAAKEAVRAGQRFRPSSPGGNREMEMLSAILAGLRSDGFETLPLAILPPPDRPTVGHNMQIVDMYSDEQLEYLLRTVFSEFLSLYEQVVSASFGRFGRGLETFAALPLTVVASVTRGDPCYDIGFDYYGGIQWAFAKPLYSGELPRICINPSEDVFPRPQYGSRMQTAFGHELPFGYTRCGLSSILVGEEFAPLGSISSGATPIRSLVLSQIKEDLRKLKALPLAWRDGPKEIS
jgi:hypothetical protein